MKEIWRNIPGYENYYEASNTGLIRSVDRKIILKDRKGNDRPSIYKGRVLKPCKRTYSRSNIKPRLQVVLSVGSKTKSWDVHRLIAITFIPNPYNYDTVNHKDGNPFNNQIENLEWISRAENNRHAFKNGLVNTQKPVAQLDPITKEIIKVYPGESEACRRMGVLQGKIRQAMQKGYKLHGFYWKYIENEGVTTIEPWYGNQAVE
jgi:hypothetical protein